MRVLILTPTAFPTVSGNAVTVERWRRILTENGMDVEVLASDGINLIEFQRHLRRIRPDVVHVHHAFKTGRLLIHPQIMPQWNDTAVVVTPGGTDINEDIALPEKQETVLRVFKLARSVLFQNPAVLPRLQQLINDSGKQIVYVPKSVCWFGDEFFDIRTIAACTPEQILFLLPAGVRPVKGNLECLEQMRQVHALRPQIRFVAAGPALDDEYAGRFEKRIQECSHFARWIKMIPAAAMRSAYRASDVVLNYSRSEGFANSLMEAMAEGLPVLASDIEGNRWPVSGTDGGAPAGLLFSLNQPEDFIEKALALIDNQTFRTALSQAARVRQNLWNNPETEACTLIAAYQTARNGLVKE